MFIIESEDMKKGGSVKWDGLYRLRHLTLKKKKNFFINFGKKKSTNFYLAIGETPGWETEEIVNKIY